MLALGALSSVQFNLAIYLLLIDSVMGHVSDAYVRVLGGHIYQTLVTCIGHFIFEHFF